MVISHLKSLKLNALKFSAVCFQPIKLCIAWSIKSSTTHIIIILSTPRSESWRMHLIQLRLISLYFLSCFHSPRATDPDGWEVDLKKLQTNETKVCCQNTNNVCSRLRNILKVMNFSLDNYNICTLLCKIAKMIKDSIRKTGILSGIQVPCLEEKGQQDSSVDLRNNTNTAVVIVIIICH